MKTTITEELELPDDRRAALSREALRLGISVNQLVKRVLLKKSEQIIESESSDASAVNFTLYNWRLYKFDRF